MRALTGRRRLRAALSGTIAATRVATGIAPACADPAPDHADRLKRAQRDPRPIAVDADIEAANATLNKAGLGKESAE